MLQPDVTQKGSPEGLIDTQARRAPSSRAGASGNPVAQSDMPTAEQQASEETGLLTLLPSEKKPCRVFCLMA